jgi:hypothetical protein
MKPAATLSRTIACLAVLAAGTPGRAAEVVHPTPGVAPGVAALRVTLDFPAGAAGTLHVTVRDAARRKTLFEADSHVTAEAGRPPLTLPGLRPGRYVFSVRRAEAPPRRLLGFPDPVAVRLFVRWRDAAIVEGQSSGRGRSGRRRSDQPRRRRHPRAVCTVRPRQLERWRCGGPSGLVPAPAAGSGSSPTSRGHTDRRGRLGRPARHRVAGPNGYPNSPDAVTLARPRRVSATVLDGEDRPLVGRESSSTIVMNAGLRLPFRAA